MAEEFVKAQIKGNKVVVFLKPSCPYCVLAKDVVSKYSFKSGHLELIDISDMNNMDAIQDYLQQITGARTVSRFSTRRYLGVVFLVVFFLALLKLLTHFCFQKRQHGKPDAFLNIQQLYFALF